jgi:site-specific DNA recombinase
MKAAIYARYSSDNQRDASIEDQVHQCRKRIHSEGWHETEVYSDRAISGASTIRPGYQQMLQAARNGAFDILVSEALDRLSRDQENIAGLYKHLSFASVQLITLAEGEINELHVGLKGTMNALFLKDLAQKTRRGLEGRIRQGKSAGGNAFGYDVVQKFTADGTPARGDRTINQFQAQIVHRIYKDYAAGISPRAIAHRLNAEDIPGPRGNPWGTSTIHGNWRRGTGILNNELYIGRLVWNRQRFIKDPDTGKRQARLNPEQGWVVEDVPHLKIINQDLWGQVKDRQQATRERVITKTNGVRSERARRPRYLLSGLLTCGTCGGGYSKINQHHYGCSTARNKGTCDNRLSMRRDVIETAVLGGLKEHLMHPDLVAKFIEEFTAEFNRLAASNDQDKASHQTEFNRVTRELTRLIEAIKSGVPGDAVKDEIATLEVRKTDLTAILDATPPPQPRLHPNISLVYRDKVTDLVDALNDEGTRTEASEAIRALIDEIRLVPKGGILKIELYGELAALLALGQNKHPRSRETGVQVTLVAGVGFEPTTFRL